MCEWQKPGEIAERTRTVFDFTVRSNTVKLEKGFLATCSQEIYQLTGNLRISLVEKSDFAWIRRSGHPLPKTPDSIKLLEFYFG